MLKHHIRVRIQIACLIAALSMASDLTARVISYAPVTSNFSRPAVQQRSDRFYLLLENDQPFVTRSGATVLPVTNERGQIVIYDRLGIEEPRRIFRRDDPGDLVELVAMNVTEDGVRHILISANEIPGEPSPRKFFYSTDAGNSWRTVSLPANDVWIHRQEIPDVGGPIVRERGSQIRLGNASTPFVFAARHTSFQLSTVVHAFDANGSTRPLIEIAPPGNEAVLIGSNRTGSEFLLRGRPVVDGVTQQAGVWAIDVQANLRKIAVDNRFPTFAEGWIRPDGAAYLDETVHISPFVSVSGQMISLGAEGERDDVLSSELENTSGRRIFAVPTHDYKGAWIVDRQGPSQATRLLRHDPDAGLMIEWIDISGPDVEAIHPADSGERVLIQVHRPRAMDNRIIVDPALAIWEVGHPAPKDYDELFLAEGPMKGFVSLDVDAAAQGGEFVFDSARVVWQAGGGGRFSGGGGGGQDVSQEWGVVRASLQQRLVLPAIARLPGAYGSFWKTDVIFSNPENEELTLRLEYVPTGSEDGGIEKNLRLQPNELRLIEDALRALFEIENGGGALFVTPEPMKSVNVTSRTYSSSSDGTYGMGVGAIDLMAASGPRFPLSFAAALHGESSRTNLLVTDASGRGTSVRVSAAGPMGALGDSVQIEVPAGSQVQLNDVGRALGNVRDAAASFETLRGYSIPTLVAIDNVTNDPTLFPPDRAAGAPRMIPMIGHTTGANGSQFRTDLYLFNPSDHVDSLMLQAKPIDSDLPVRSLHFTLLPREAKMIPDAYRLLFGLEGLGKLIFSSEPSRNDGVRVTARTYNSDPEGGTYGFTMPALNAFQSAGPGESLEILGAIVDDRFRTNLAIIDTINWSNGQTSEVLIEIFGSGGELLDSFEVEVLNGRGAHLTDLFTGRSLQSDTPRPVIIRVSPVQGVFAAFATLVDNRTNDPIYLEPGLMAQ